MAALDRCSARDRPKRSAPARSTPLRCGRQCPREGEGGLIHHGASLRLVPANLGTHRVVGSPAAAADEVRVALWDEPGCDAGADCGAAKVLADHADAPVPLPDAGRVPGSAGEVEARWKPLSTQAHLQRVLARRLAPSASRHALGVGDFRRPVGADRAGRAPNRGRRDGRNLGHVGSRLRGGGAARP